MAFEWQPTLKGQLVELRPLRESDFPEVFAVASDPLIWEQHPSSDRYKEEVFRRFFREAMESGGAFVAIDAQNGKIIGSSRFYGYNAEKSEVEIGSTFLARSHWGGAYNKEMKRLMLSHAFRFVNRVIFVVGPENFRSRRAVEKIGGVLAGSRLDGDGQARLVYELTATSFARQAV